MNEQESMRGEQAGFLEAFPEVYREEGGFFTRYLSVFEQIYQKVQEEIEGAHRLLDPGTASTERLILFAGWLGFDCGEKRFTKEELKGLVEQLYFLNRRKGTPDALKTAAEIVGQGPAQVRETTEGEVHLLTGCSWSAEREEKMRELFSWLLPAGVICRLHYKEEAVFVGHSGYLDAGARMQEIPGASLDAGIRLGSGRLRGEEKRKEEDI